MREGRSYRFFGVTPTGGAASFPFEVVFFFRLGAVLLLGAALFFGAPFFAFVAPFSEGAPVGVDGLDVRLQAASNVESMAAIASERTKGRIREEGKGGSTGQGTRKAVFC
jgi:hypothetical protein